MCDFGMELNSVDRKRVVRESGERSGFGRGNDGEVLWKRVKSIGMRHPNLFILHYQFVAQACRIESEQGIRAYLR